MCVGNDSVPEEQIFLKYYSCFPLYLRYFRFFNGQMNFMFVVPKLAVTHEERKNVKYFLYFGDIKGLRAKI